MAEHKSKHNGKDEKKSKKNVVHDAFRGKKVSKLMKKHSELLEQFKEMIPKEYKDRELEGVIVDDIFYLRFVLSHLDDLPAALEALIFTYDYRTSHAEMFARRRRGEKTSVEEFLLKYNIQAYHKSTHDGGPVLILRNGMVDFKALMPALDPEDMISYSLLQREDGFVLADQVTRETGRLVKLVIVQDMKCAGFVMPDRKMMSSIGEASKMSEKMYPQLLGRFVIVNPPGWMKMAMKLFRPFMSAKTLAKMSICEGTGLDEHEISQCPFAGAEFEPASVPTFLGGTCDCEGGCVPGIPNDQKEQIAVPKEIVKEFIKRKKEGKI